MDICNCFNNNFFNINNLRSLYFHSRIFLMNYSWSCETDISIYQQNKFGCAKST